MEKSLTIEGHISHLFSKACFRLEALFPLVSVFNEYQVGYQCFVPFLPVLLGFKPEIKDSLYCYYYHNHSWSGTRKTNHRIVMVVKDLEVHWVQLFTQHCHVHCQATPQMPDHHSPGQSNAQPPIQWIHFFLNQTKHHLELSCFMSKKKRKERTKGFAPVKYL